MRARNLKPAFFENEDLGSSDPLHSLLFAGLWCAADREGRLEDRPLRLCGQIFRYRREVTLERMDELLAWLNAHGFIKRYERDGGRYVQVVQFLKHQRPHSKEKNSEIPPFSNGRKTRPRRGQAPTKEGASTDLGHVEHALTPDSGLLTPDSGLLNPDPPLRGVRAKVRPGAGRGNAGAPSAGGGGKRRRGGESPSGKTAEERVAEARAAGKDPFAMPGEPGYDPTL